MEHPDTLPYWQNRTAVVATMHHKESVIAPILHAELGVAVLVPDNFDTDRFGTFTRETARTGNQLEAARAKALAAMKLTGADLGCASEGSFGNHPHNPFIRSNLEIVVLIDTVHDVEIIGQYRNNATHVKSQTAQTAAEVVDIANAWGFPHQGVILRQSARSTKHIHKELTTTADLHAAATQLLSKWYTTSVCLETDMRAHRCPARMHNIKEATAHLVQNCLSGCPRCHTPGFVITNTIPGLPCSSCGASTDLTKAIVRTCAKCTHSETKSVDNQAFASPADCPVCNP